MVIRLLDRKRLQSDGLGAGNYLRDFWSIGVSRFEKLESAYGMKT